jgi:hypothetical protein
MRLKILDDKGAPFGSGMKLELVGDGQVLGRARLQENGEADFDVPSSNVKRLSVRLDLEQHLCDPFNRKQISDH